MKKEYFCKTIFSGAVLLLPFFLTAKTCSFGDAWAKYGKSGALRESEIILKQAANNRLIEDFLSFLKGLSLRKGNGEMVVRLMISYDDCKDGLRVYYM